MPKNGCSREESLKGHLGFKSAVSPLFSSLEEKERKIKRLLSCVQPNLIARQKDGKSERKKASAKSKLGKRRCLQANHQQKKTEGC